MTRGSASAFDQVLEHELEAPALPCELEPDDRDRDTIPAPPPDWGNEVG
jgi:hypothetical protein